ncbi:MAG: hypothetical protein O7G84_00860 [Gammaproteobacteria bacterium]|nr:hypothetical protein [Gammaproteobacteria bacterium]
MTDEAKGSAEVPDSGGRAMYEGFLRCMNVEGRPWGELEVAEIRAWGRAAAVALCAPISAGHAAFMAYEVDSRHESKIALSPPAAWEHCPADFRAAWEQAALKMRDDVEAPDSETDLLEAASNMVCYLYDMHNDDAGLQSRREILCVAIAAERDRRRVKR